MKILVINWRLIARILLVSYGWNLQHTLDLAENPMLFRKGDWIPTAHEICRSSCAGEGWSTAVAISAYIDYQRCCTLNSCAGKSQQARDFIIPATHQWKVNTWWNVISASDYYHNFPVRYLGCAGSHSISWEYLGRIWHLVLSSVN